MARPRSDEKREAVLEAAIRVVALSGLGSATATIAKEAGVANGTLFTYFPTKADLWNALYLELKAEMTAAALDGIPAASDGKAAVRHLWDGWLTWATSSPQRRRTLALLQTSDDITPQSHRQGQAAMAPAMKHIEQCRKNGPMANANIQFVGGLLNAIAEATIDFVLADPENANRYRDDGFEALWRTIA
jgi:AcrR family transcriptional regulator